MKYADQWTLETHICDAIFIVCFILLFFFIYYVLYIECCV